MKTCLSWLLEGQQFVFIRLQEIFCWFVFTVRLHSLIQLVHWMQYIEKKKQTNFKCITNRIWHQIINNSCWPWDSVMNKNIVYKNEEILCKEATKCISWRSISWSVQWALHNNRLVNGVTKITGTWSFYRTQKPLFKLFRTFAAMSILLSAKYVCPMLKRFLPDVISCWEESVLPSRAMKFINASWNLPCSMKVTPSFQIRSVCTIDMSSILKRLGRVQSRKTISETNQNA